MSYFLRKLTRMGDGYGVGIPVEMMQQTGWKQGQTLKLQLKENGEVYVVISKLDPAEEQNIEMLRKKTARKKKVEKE